jgi:hypothetical protein
MLTQLQVASPTVSLSHPPAIPIESQSIPSTNHESAELRPRHEEHI